MEASSDVLIGTTGVVCDPSGVDRPLHYNNHPSGVEAIEVARNMNFNLGSAFKYMVRLYDKGTPLKDAKKALWYVQDQRHNCYVEKITYPPDERIKCPLMTKILDAEADPLVREALRYIHLFQNTDFDYFGNKAVIAVARVVHRLEKPVFDNQCQSC